jgi:hypothetical protein
VRSHSVRLFDRTDSAGRYIAAFVLDGLRKGETVLVVASAEHWLAALGRLVALGAAVPGAIASGQLTVLDAASLLDRCAPGGTPAPAAFDGSVAPLVRELAARPVPLRIYGEMVNLLAARGAFEEAERLEHLWNRLAAEVPFSLLCGYSAVHFGNAASDEMLQRICKTHSEIEAAVDDELSLWLLTQTGVLGALSPSRDAVVSDSSSG